MKDIVEAPCRIESWTWAKTKGAENDDGKRVAQPQAAMNVRLFFKNAKDKPWLDDLVPALDQQLTKLAGVDNHNGLSTKAKIKLKDGRVIFQTPDNKAICELRRAAVTNDPALNIDGRGEGSVLLRVVATMDLEDVPDFLAYVANDADVLVTLTSSQLDWVEGGAAAA